VTQILEAPAQPFQAGQSPEVDDEAARAKQPGKQPNNLGIAYPWSDPRPARYTLAWVNAELMKNVAEIGAVRHLWAASRDQG
jgi:hypothetical protein